MIEPILHRILVKPYNFEEHDDVYRSAKNLGIITTIDSQAKREQQAIDHGTVLAFGPTVFKDYGADNPLKEGDQIVYARHAGKRITDPETKQELLVINDEDVVAILKKGE
jgi:co-chaperonin GroES (HSP10)